MSEVKLIFHNYGLTPNGEYELHDGTIFFMQGPNERGKTTFLNGIRALMEVKDDKVNPVTFGQKEGHIIGSPITGADGLEYTVRYDFDDQGKKKFVIIRPDGSKIANITDMRAIFNYTHFTVTDWWTMSMSEPGRKKQREFFMNMLTQEEQQELALIENRINEKTGGLFVERKNLKSDVIVLEAQAKSHVFTQEEREVLAYGSTIDTMLTDLKLKKEAAEKTISSAGVNAERLNSLKTTMAAMETNFNDQVQNINDEIKELEEKIRIKKETLATVKVNYVNNSKTTKESIEELEPLVDVEALRLAQEALTGTDKEPGLTERIAKGERIQRNYDSIVGRQQTYTQAAADLKAKKERIETLDTNIELDRVNKKKIVSESKNIPARWGIDDEGVTFDGIPFVESDISTSKSACAVAELMILVNQAPIMLMGDAEVLGYPVLAELKALAVQHNKIMIFAEHDRVSKDVHLVCYDELDTPEEVVPNNKLF